MSFRILLQYCITLPLVKVRSCNPFSLHFILIKTIKIVQLLLLFLIFNCSKRSTIFIIVYLDLVKKYHCVSLVSQQAGLSANHIYNNCDKKIFKILGLEPSLVDPFSDLQFNGLHVRPLRLTCESTLWLIHSLPSSIRCKNIQGDFET